MDERRNGNQNPFELNQRGFLVGWRSGLYSASEWYGLIMDNFVKKQDC
jgi:hypothetical protein